MICSLAKTLQVSVCVGDQDRTLVGHSYGGAVITEDGFLFLDREQFPASFAGDLPAEQAAFLADSQVPWGVDALGGSITEPAWRVKPSWYLVATEDR